MLELSSFVRPDHLPGSPSAMANELGLRNVAFEVDNLQTVLDRLVADGYRLVGAVGQYEDAWRMAYVRGPEGIIVSLAQRIWLGPHRVPGRPSPCKEPTLDGRTGTHSLAERTERVEDPFLDGYRINGERHPDGAGLATRASIDNGHTASPTAIQFAPNPALFPPEELGL